MGEDVGRSGLGGADQLVGVGAVHLRTRRAAGGAAGLARDRQDPAGFVDGRITVQQFPGGAVDLALRARPWTVLDILALLCKQVVTAVQIVVGARPCRHRVA